MMQPQSSILHSLGMTSKSLIPFTSPLSTPPRAEESSAYVCPQDPWSSEQLLTTTRGGLPHSMPHNPPQHSFHLISFTGCTLHIHCRRQFRTHCHTRSTNQTHSASNDGSALTTGWCGVSTSNVTILSTSVCPSFSFPKALASSPLMLAGGRSHLISFPLHPESEPFLLTPFLLSPPFLWPHSPSLFICSPSFTTPFPQQRGRGTICGPVRLATQPYPTSSVGARVHPQDSVFYFTPSPQLSLAIGSNPLTSRPRHIKSTCSHALGESSTSVSRVLAQPVPNPWGLRATQHLPANPHLTAGRRAQLGRTPAGGGSFRPYNHPPPTSSPVTGPLGISSQPSAPSSSAYVAPTSMLGCVAQSDTTRPKKCTCGGMLAPRRFSSGSTSHKCAAPNCGSRFNFKKAPFYQCTNCLSTFCPVCRLGRPQHAGTLPNDYVSKRKRDSLAASSSSQLQTIVPPLIVVGPVAVPPQPRIPAGTTSSIPPSPTDGFPAIGERDDDTFTQQSSAPPPPPSSSLPAPSLGTPLPLSSQVTRPYVPGGGEAVTSSGQTLQTDEGRSTTQRSIANWFTIRRGSNTSLISMVMYGLLACAPAIAEVATPPVMPTAMAPPSLTIISAANQQHDLGDLITPALSPFSLGVLQQMRDLPVYDSLTTLTYCPKGSARRFGIIYAASFWYQNIAMDCSPLHQ